MVDSTRILSRFRALFTIDRGSTFAYKGKRTRSILCSQQTIEWRNCGVFRKFILQIEILWSRHSSKYHLEQFIIFRIRPYFYTPIVVIGNRYLNIFRNTIPTDDPAYPREIHLIVVYLNGKRRIGHVPKRRTGLGDICPRRRPQPPMTASSSRIPINNSWVSLGISHSQSSIAKSPEADEVPPSDIHSAPRQPGRNRRRNRKEAAIIADGTAVR